MNTLVGWLAGLSMVISSEFMHANVDTGAAAKMQQWTRNNNNNYSETQYFGTFNSHIIVFLTYTGIQQQSESED